MDSLIRIRFFARGFVVSLFRLLKGTLLRPKSFSKLLPTLRAEGSGCAAPIRRRQTPDVAALKNTATLTASRHVGRPFRRPLPDQSRWTRGRPKSPRRAGRRHRPRFPGNGRYDPGQKAQRSLADQGRTGTAMASTAFNAADGWGVSFGLKDFQDA
jgi:hypothetical protein